MTPNPSTHYTAAPPMLTRTTSIVATTAAITLGPVEKRSDKKFLKADWEKEEKGRSRKEGCPASHDRI